MAGENNLEDKQVTFYAAWIKEECLEPYYIEISDNAFDVIKKVMRKEEKSGEYKEGKEQIGCFSDVRGALKRIAALKYDKGVTYTINGFIKQYDDCLKRFELNVPQIKM